MQPNRERAGSALAALGQLAPALLVHLDAELLRRREDALPRRIALRVAHALDLVEAGDGIAHMRSILQRLLALVRKGELLAGQVVAILGLESGHGNLRATLRSRRAATAVPDGAR